MNRKQIIVLWIGIAVIVVMGIFPPWMLKKNEMLQNDDMQGFILMNDVARTTLELPVRFALFHNYYPIWSRPKDGTDILLLLEIDIVELSIQWIIVIAITGGLLVTFKDKKD